MQAKNFDYNTLKLEYFMSDIPEVKRFWIEKGLKYNTQVGEHTRGRGKEKQKRLDDITAKALERKKNEIAKKLEIPVEDLFKTKKQAIELMKTKLKQYMKKVEIDELDAPIIMKDVEKIWKMTKVELWEPTIVAQNTGTIDANVNTSWPLVQIIRDGEDLPDDHSNDEIDDE